MIGLILFGVIIAMMIFIGASSLYGRRGDRKNCRICQGKPGYSIGHPDENLCNRHYQIALRAWLLAGDGD